VDGADAAVGQAAGAVGDLVMDVAGGELRSVAIPQLGLVQAAVDAALAVGELAVYSGVHSKSLRPSGFAND
jgi:hypothetical protein